MVTLSMLWLPILVATVLVFVASNIVWMALPHHKSDTRKFPDEGPAMEALGKQGLTPGVYRFPAADTMAQMKEPAFVAKLEKGPVGLLTILPSGPFNMGKQLTSWTAYIVVISIFVAYVASRTLAPGTPYLAVFRLVGTVAILAYSGAQAPSAIWWGKPWVNAWKEIADGVLYGLLTAGAFGWLWPR
jgi:hypothetical protein